MKISYLTPRFKPSIGGIETLVYETSKYVLSKKNTVKVFTSKLTGKYDQKLKKMEYINGIQVHRSFAFPLLPIKGGMVNIMPKMLIDVLRDNADIYHSFGVGTFPSIMGYLKKMKKKPVVITPILYNTTEGKLAQTIIDNLSKNILKSADKVIAQTKSEKKYLEKIGINEKKIEIIPLFANPDRFTPYNIGKDEFRKKHGLKKFVVLFVGRIDIWQKGLDHLLNALAIVKKKLPVSLVISGDDFGSKKK